MAANRWLRRVLLFLLVVLISLASSARAGHFLTHPSAPDVLAPITQARPPVALGHAKSSPLNAEVLFERGVELDSGRDANVYITPRNLPRNDRLLKTYSAENAGRAGVNGSTVPGLLGIAAQAYRARDRADGTRVYSLADAMRDAVWRKNTAAKLKTLLSFHHTPCATGADASNRAPSMFGSGC